MRSGGPGYNDKDATQKAVPQNNPGAATARLPGLPYRYDGHTTLQPVWSTRNAASSPFTS